MKKILSIVGFIFLIFYSIWKTDKSPKSENDNYITQSSEIRSKIDQFKLKHGKLRSYKFIDDTLSFQRIEANFYEDQILTEDEIELSIRYAFMPQIYQDKAIALQENRRIVIQGNFFYTKRYKNKKYRTINFVVFKDIEGKIRINKTLDLAERQNVIKLPARIINKRLLVNSSINDNRKKKKIQLNQQIRFSILNNTLYWTFEDIKSNNAYSIEPYILKGINLEFSLKPEGTIDSLKNFASLKVELVERIDSVRKNLLQEYSNENYKVNDYLRDIISTIQIREYVEMTIGRDAFLYFKTGSIGLAETKIINNENIEEYPYSKLPILTKGNIEFIDAYSDSTSYYKLTSFIDHEMIIEVDSILGISNFNKLVNRMKYLREVDYYLNSNHVPYFTNELSILEDGKYKIERKTRIELIN